MPYVFWSTVWNQKYWFLAIFSSWLKRFIQVCYKVYFSFLWGQDQVEELRLLVGNQPHQSRIDSVADTNPPLEQETWTPAVAVPPEVPTPPPGASPTSGSKIWLGMQVTPPPPTVLSPTPLACWVTSLIRCSWTSLEGEWELPEAPGHPVSKFPSPEVDWCQLQCQRGFAGVDYWPTRLSTWRCKFFHLFKKTNKQTAKTLYIFIVLNCSWL